MNKKPVIRIGNPSSVDYTFPGQAPRITTDKQDTESEEKEKNLRKSIKDLKSTKYHKTNINAKSRRNHSPVYE